MLKKVLNINYFKKISTLDCLVVLVLVFAASFALIYFSREKSIVYINVTSVEREVEMGLIPDYYWVSNSIEKGSIAYSSTGGKVAEVVDVDNWDEGGQRRFSRLKLKVHAVYDKRTKIHRLGGESLLVGRVITFDFSDTRFVGMITYVGIVPEPAELQHSFLELRLKVEKIPPWLATTYNESFKMTNTEGEEIFRITAAKIQPAEISVRTDQGKIVRGFDPINKDVYLTAIARVFCQEGVCYFNEVYPVKVGLNFRAQSGTSIIRGDDTTIMSLRKIKSEEQ